MEVRIITLFKKYIEEQCSAQELEEVLSILKNGGYQSEWQQVISDESDSILNAGLQTELSSAEVDRIYEGIASQLPSAKLKTIKLWPRVAIAAAIAAVIFTAGLTYFYQQDKREQSIAYANDVAPGKQGATLTLANGQKILIKDALAGTIASQSGVKILKNADGSITYELSGQKPGQLQYNTLSTGKGEEMRLRLPDGSVVFLNAASSIKYPTNCAILPQRKVFLSGEGYFEIAKDKAHPFIVESNKQQVEVLGTHFNVNAYLDEPVVTTTLIEGSVKISSGGRQKVIHPGEQVLNASGSLMVTNANLDNITDWKNGDFNLTDVDFRVAMRKIARWYNVELVYDATVPENIQADGWISRKQTLAAVLDMIQRLGMVHFRVEGKKVYVSK
ncbi:FecR domain-containing protein [Pedobacter sp. MC2016-14]|uniref:FecR family protein n=1 Tax=Pedobacter sp. MC2016-14 TaxID=2897327 RepID=UPI001E573089|nr:FecR family protein [Pedobacter sp. MC2016-14]MCD0489892.1 FecR domain-containing protein [Pedobacter sp. MC2016-14]